MKGEECDDWKNKAKEGMKPRKEGKKEGSQVSKPRKEGNKWEKNEASREERKKGR